jgi:DNA recombination protein RmuC
VDVSLIDGLIGVGFGLIIGGTAIWLFLSGRLSTVREQGRGEGQVERTALQGRLTRADYDLGQLGNQLTELRAISETTRKDLEVARSTIASLTAKTEQIPPLSAELAQLRQETKSLVSELAGTQAELAKTGKHRDHLNDQVIQLTTDLQTRETTIRGLQEERQRLAVANSALETEIEKERTHTAEKLAFLTQAKDELGDRFKSIAAEILDEKSKKFTDLNASNMSTILDPLKAKLDEFKVKVEDTYDKESKQRFSLELEIKKLVTMTNQLDAEAKNLTQALKGDSKARGTWGEIVLERVLERSGLREGQEYRTQASFQTDDGGRSQPDVVVDLPQNRNVVIDSKVSLVAYERFVSEENSILRDKHLAEHVASVRNHVQQLSAKNYQTLYQLNSLDFVLMFIPIEAAFSIAIQTGPDVFTDAFSRNVLIVTPSTLLATLRTIAFTWNQEYQTRNAQEIARQAGNLFDKFVLFAGTIQAIGQRIEQSQQAYEQAYKQLASGKGNLIKQAERLRELGVQPSKSIPQPMLEAASMSEDRVELPTPPASGAGEEKPL